MAHASVIKRRILIIDDSNIVRIVLSKGLIDKGFEIVGTASTGNIGLDMTLNLEPDFVIIDNLLPDMMGSDLAVMIKQKSKQENLKIIMLSTLNDPELIKETKNKGVDDYIIKPVAYHQLIEEIYLACVRAT